jgi:hypothetical protein
MGSSHPSQGASVERSMKRKLAVGATGLAVLSGAGVAYGVTQSGGNERQAFLNDVAKRLNVPPSKLSSALKGAFEDRLQAAVQAGRLTQQQADAIKKRVEATGGGVWLGPGPGPGLRFFHRGPGGPGGPRRAGFGAAAKYLGLTDLQLFNQLRSGKSLADIAGARGKSVDGLKNAIKDAVKTDLDAAVKDQRLTQTEETNILGKLDKGLDNLVNRKGLIPPPGFRGPGLWRAKHGALRFGAFPGGQVPVPPGGPVPEPPGAAGII